MVVIDHKALSGNAKKALGNTKKYAPQLALYGEAAEQARSKPILGLYINLPLHGVLVELKVKKGSRIVEKARLAAEKVE